ncbi:hypothetical protein DYY67_0548 [Candidatus Nitrosotalea sp. TS]|uniref:hypothetical protein n=1 Tax=Candidatus Nitrosotalea sp. TS TaxID=2341020 RepID=UPI001407A831|nr:hypothetical protein [Candidatus Nitrosotalea sp. TS]NHI02509.1 hypothetical protein [Candidatus Nitrosotalea sp. TS]
MTTQSKWVIEDETKNQVVRASTIKPRLDYATETVDGILEVLVQKRRDLNESNVSLYRRSDGTAESLKALESEVRRELEISYAVESLRQVRRSLDSIAGMGNVPAGLAPTISLVRIVRSRMLSLLPATDFELGELSLVLSGVIIDAAHLASACLDFEKANEESRRLLDEAKLIADSKIYKQFPNLDFLQGLSC